MFWEILIGVGIAIVATWLVISTIGIIFVIKEVDSDPNDLD